MIDLALPGSLTRNTVQARVVRSRIAWVVWFIALLGLTGIVGLITVVRGPHLSMIAWLIYLAGAVAILYRPRYGIYLILFFGLVGDSVLIPWFPFVKNFSSYESLLFLHDAVIISPLESYIILTFISWLGRGIVQRKLNLFAGSLFWPALSFLAFVIVGFIYGVGTGGNLNIALWEARPLFYLVAILVLTSNLMEKREHFTVLIWLIMLALFLEAISGNFFYFITLKRNLSGIESITEHAAAVHMNTVFILLLAAWLYKASPSLRIWLLVILPSVAISYLATQRRAAMVALMIALFLLFIILFLDNRKLFWLLTPPVVLIGVVYLALFWNSQGALGLPARSIKSVILPDQASLRDQSSNIYRVIENTNTGFTIRQKPLTGVGFGQKFYILVPMADISFFDWWEYFPHNSIIWIWIKTGVGGFIAMLYMVGMAIMVGVNAFRRMPPNNLRAIAVTGTLYIVMHFVYAYVDISWDTQSMLYVGAVMGVLNCMVYVVAKPVSAPGRRWPWQEQIQPDPELVTPVSLK